MIGGRQNGMVGGYGRGLKGGTEKGPLSVLKESKRTFFLPPPVVLSNSISGEEQWRCSPPRLPLPTMESARTHYAFHIQFSPPQDMAVRVSIGGMRQDWGWRPVSWTVAGWRRWWERAEIGIGCWCCMRFEGGIRRSKENGQEIWGEMGGWWRVASLQ